MAKKVKITIFGLPLILISCGNPSQTASLISSNSLSSPTPTPTPTFVPIAASTITGISPTSGSVNGGTLITLSGTRFFPTGNRILIGDAPCDQPNWLSSTAITCITEASSYGVKTVILIDISGNTSTYPPSGGTNRGGFTYVANPPTLGVPGSPTPSSTPLIYPTTGPTSGGSTFVWTPVQIAGDNFLNGAVVTIGSQPCCAPQPSPTTSSCSNTSLTVQNSQNPNLIQCLIPPNALIGGASLTITNPDSQSAVSSGPVFFYTP